MALHENGVLFYAIGYARVKVGFANGNVCCKICKFSFVENKGTELERTRCRLNDDEIIPPKCALYGVLPDCPIKFTGEIEPQDFELPQE